MTMSTVICPSEMFVKLVWGKWWLNGSAPENYPSISGSNPACPSHTVYCTIPRLIATWNEPSS